MTELYFKDPRDYIVFEHNLRKVRRPAYSMRAFARDLAVSPSSLNDFLKARVGMSEERIENIALSLNWSAPRKEHFRDLVQAKFERDAGIRQSAMIRVKSRIKESGHGLSLDVFKVISDWYHLVILEMCEMQDHLSAQQINKDLKLASGTGQRAIDRLLKLKLLKKTAQGYKPESGTSHAGDEGTSAAVKAFHAQVLNLATEALQNNEGEAYDSHSLFYSIDQADLPKMNAELRKSMLAILSRYAQTKNANCIQGLSLQIFPIWSKQIGEQNL
ncbi:MAG: TIGR02147 family protein [Bdellovibrionaceae bacterium]|nr:TIGR02147 family protein [Bdellovibrio sp.]